MTKGAMTKGARLVVENDETMAVLTSDDVVRVRQAVRIRAVAAGFGIVDQTKLVTAASEIARNTVDYGGGGTLRIEVLREGARRGLQLTFSDSGPGIADIKTAMAAGYSTGGGLGLGLSGAKRLSNEFAIESVPGKGTTVTLARWKL
jgi:serine/threonine-protein kinase RsbT